MEILFTSVFAHFEAILVTVLLLAILAIWATYGYEYIVRIVQIFWPKKRDARIQGRDADILKNRELIEQSESEEKNSSEELPPPLTVEEIDEVVEKTEEPENADENHEKIISDDADEDSIVEEELFDDMNENVSKIDDIQALEPGNENMQNLSEKLEETFKNEEAPSDDNKISENFQTNEILEDREDVIQDDQDFSDDEKDKKSESELEVENLEKQEGNEGSVAEELPSEVKPSEIITKIREVEKQKIDELQAMVVTGDADEENLKNIKQKIQKNEWMNDDEKCENEEKNPGNLSEEQEEKSLRTDEISENRENNEDSENQETFEKISEDKILEKIENPVQNEENMENASDDKISEKSETIEESSKDGEQKLEKSENLADEEQISEENVEKTSKTQENPENIEKTFEEIEKESDDFFEKEELSEKPNKEEKSDKKPEPEYVSERANDLLSKANQDINSIIQKDIPKVDPHIEELYELTKQAKTLMARGLSAEAQMKIIEGLALKKDHRELNLLLWEIYESEKRFDKAEIIYRDLALVHTEDEEILKHLANNLIIGKKYNIAYEIYKKILSFGQDDENSLYMLANLAREMNDMSDVYHYSRLYLKSWPMDRDMLSLLSESQILLGKRKEAIETLTKLKNLSPYDAVEISEYIEKLKTEEEMARNFQTENNAESLSE